MTYFLSLVLLFIGWHVISYPVSGASTVGAIMLLVGAVTIIRGIITRDLPLFGGQHE